MEWQVIKYMALISFLSAVSLLVIYIFIDYEER